MSSTPVASILIVGLTYFEPQNQGKLQELGKYFDLHCATCKREDITHFGNKLETPELTNPNFKLHRLTLQGPVDRLTRTTLVDLKQVLQKQSYELVFCEAEPWSYLRRQCYKLCRKYQPQAKFGEFTWENFRRTGLKGIILKQVYSKVVNNTDFMVAGNSEGGEILKNYGLEESKLYVAPQLGVDTKKYPKISSEKKLRLRKDRHLPTEAPIIGYCGRMVESKGIKELINAIKLINTRRESAEQVQLCLMGSGPETNRIESNNQPSWLHLFDPCPQDQVAEFLQLLDVFVLASKEAKQNGKVIWKEQFGHVIIECMSCGIPIVGSKSGAIPEVIAQQACLFDTGSSQGIANCLQSIIENASLRAQILDTQEQRLGSYYSLEAHGMLWKEIFEQALSS